MKKQLIALGAVSLLAIACGKKDGGGDIAARAEKAANAACECTTVDCTREHVAALNKMSIKEKDAVEKLSDERKAVYKDAQKRAGDCQFKLKTAK